MTTLNLSNYKTVWNDNFTQDKGFNSSIWDHEWGNSDDFVFNSNGLTITSYQSEGWSNAGFIQPNHGANNSQGYGLYSATAYTGANQGIGICILLWPATDAWPGPEIDFLEDWSDSTDHTGYFTIHWKGPNDSNGQDIHQFSLDLTKPHTYALDWESTYLNYYIDGTLMYHVTGSEVPKDYADGGQNLAFGAEVTAASTGPQPGNKVSLTISDMSYAAYVPNTGPSITVSAPGTVQEANVGAGVNVKETVSVSGVTTAYEAVFTSANVAETGWTAVSLSGGSGSFTAHFAHSGDYVKVVDNTAAPTVTGASAAITITDPGVTPTIDVSSPGTVNEASVGAGVNVTETITVVGIGAVYEAVFNTANVAYQNWQAVSLNAQGVGSFTAHFSHTGDYIVAINDPNTQSVKGWSTPVTITDNVTPTTPTNIALTGDNLYATSPVGTVVGTLSATDPNPVTYSLAFNQRNLFSIVGNKLELAQPMPAHVMPAYYINVVATDSTGGTGSHPFKVVVQAGTQAAAPAAITAAATLGSASAGTFLPPSHSSILTTGGHSTVTFGSDNETVSGGADATTYVFAPGDGLETIGNFMAGKGDVLDIDHTLQGALHVATSGGSTMLTFGDASHGIVLAGVTGFTAGQIQWT